MNSIYSSYFNILQNFFVPQLKAVEITRVGTKHKRKYDKARIPYQRLIDSGKFSNYQVQKLLPRVSQLKGSLQANSYKQMCHSESEQFKVLNEGNYRNICNLLINSPECAEIPKDKRVSCEDLNQNKIDTTSWYFIKSCANGLWHSIKDLIIFVKDAIIWFVQNIDSISKKD